MPATVRVRAAYGSRAAEYAALLGTMEATASEDRALVELWARETAGPLLDLGCGPGHWTAHLTGLGHDVLGMDPTPDFLDHARRAHPGAHFAPGGVEDLDPSSVRWGGVLAWYSLIHLDPEDLPAALRRLHSCLRPGGRLLIGFFDAEDGQDPQSFAHAVVTACRYPAPMMTQLLVDAGFRIDRVERRTDPGARPHAAVLATAPTSEDGAR